MKKALTNIKNTALDLWRDDSGAQMVEKILIIAAISIPLLAVLIFFIPQITGWIRERWEAIQGTSSDVQGPTDNPF